MQSKTKKKDVGLSLIAGSCSGIVTSLTMYPLEFLRTRLQQEHVRTGPINVLRQTLAQSGIRGLYTGLPLPLMAQCVYKANVFTITGATQNVLLERRERIDSCASPRLTLNDIFLSGAVAGSINAFLFVTPVEFVRNQQIQNPLLSAKDIIRQSFQQRILWRGAGWAVVRDAFGCGCFFTSHALALDAAPTPSFTSSLAAGAVAGLSFWICALPFDTIKTWVQSGDITKPPPSVSAALSTLYERGGVIGVVRGLSRGWQVAYGRGAPSAAITIACYTFFYQQLDAFQSQSSWNFSVKQDLKAQSHG